MTSQPCLVIESVCLSSLSLHHADFFLPRHANSFLSVTTTVVAAPQPPLPSIPAMIARFSRVFVVFSLPPFLSSAVLPPPPAIQRSRVAAFLSLLPRRHVPSARTACSLSPPLFLAPKTSQCVFKVANCKLRFVARVHTQPPGRGSRRAA